MDCNVTVVFHSDTGTTEDLARAVERGAREAGARTRLRPVAGTTAGRDATRTATTEDLLWSDAVVIGTPTLFGGVSAAMLGFLSGVEREAAQGGLRDKVVTGFTVAGSPNGGQEACLLSLCDTAHHWGAVVMPTGSTPTMKRLGGNPYGLSMTRPRSGAPTPDEATEAAYVLGARAAEAADMLFAPSRITTARALKTSTPKGVDR